MSEFTTRIIPWIEERKGRGGCGLLNTITIIVQPATERSKTWGVACVCKHGLQGWREVTTREFYEIRQYTQIWCTQSHPDEPDVHRTEQITTDLEEVILERKEVVKEYCLH